MPRERKASFMVRLPFDLDDWIEAQAQMNRRSKNSEIVFRLEQAQRASSGALPPGQGGVPAAGEALRA